MLPFGEKRDHSKAFKYKSMPKHYGNARRMGECNLQAVCRSVALTANTGAAVARLRRCVTSHQVVPCKQSAFFPNLTIETTNRTHHTTSQSHDEAHGCAWIRPTVDERRFGDLMPHLSACRHDTLLDRSATKVQSPLEIQTHPESGTELFHRLSSSVAVTWCSARTMSRSRDPASNRRLFASRRASRSATFVNRSSDGVQRDRDDWASSG